VSRAALVACLLAASLAHAAPRPVDPELAALQAQVKALRAMAQEKRDAERKAKLRAEIQRLEAKQ